MVQSQRERPAEERDLSFSMRKSAISAEPFDRRKATGAFLKGLARLEPMLEVSREALLHDLPELERARHAGALLRRGSSRDIRQLVQHSLHAGRTDDDMLESELSKVPQPVQIKAAKRMLELSVLDRSNRKGFALSAWILSTSSIAAGFFTELLQPGRINPRLVLEPGWDVSKTFSLFFAAGIMVQLSAYAVLRFFNAARIRNDAREIIGSGKITDPVARGVLEDISRPTG